MAQVPKQFLKYAAGKKHYGGGRDAPNVGKTGAEGKVGYAKRDAKPKQQAAMEAIRRRLKGHG